MARRHSRLALRQFLHRLEPSVALDEFGTVLRILDIELRIDVAVTAEPQQIETERLDDNIADTIPY